MQFFIGTSGWQYDEWKGNFYTNNLPSKDWLDFYAQYFDTVEINFSFYSLGDKSIYEKWQKAVPSNFIFAVKLYRYLTHIKRLVVDEESLRILKIYLKNISVLKNNLGPVLIQLPPRMKADKERLENFLQNLVSLSEKIFESVPAFSIEFRQESWLSEDIYQILKKFNIAFCISDGPEWKTSEIITADWAYLRFHGRPKIFSSPYDKKDLITWSEKIRKLNPKKVYIYFNNTDKGNAVRNALDLKSITF